jgi:hypothetical protein
MLQNRRLVGVGKGWRPAMASAASPAGMADPRLFPAANRFRPDRAAKALIRGHGLRQHAIDTIDALPKQKGTFR